MDAPNYVLFDHAAGYALFSVKEFEDIGNMIPEVESASSDISRFASVVKLIAFIPFKDAIAALENCNAISEGVLTEFLLAFLESNIPQIKKKKMKLGVGESKLGSAISEAIEHVSSYTTGVVPEIIRGIRIHFSKLVQDLTPEVQGQAQLGLGHSYSRGKVKFNVHRVDNMIIQCIALCDQLDKDINTFCMRIREWYSYHFPELYKIVPDQYTYCRCAKLIGDRKTIDEAKLGELLEILMDEEKVNDVNEASKMSMGMDISVIDLLNIDRFASRVVALCEFRTGLKGYLTDRMDACAPSLRALVGDQVGARLISHAGSLTNLAKYPASTIQILGAEKALFRALKTKGNTPKYGLLFHSTYIGRAQAKNKGRISRYLANKCAIASRIDCFSEVPVPTFGEFLKQQVEDRLKFFETGQKVKKNVEVMHSAVEAAVDVAEKSAKKRKKRMKKEKKARQGMIDNITAAANASTQKVENGDEGTENEPPKKKKKMKKENMSETADINGDTTNEATSESGKKKKKRKMSVSASEKAESVASSSLSKKKRKRKQKS